VLACCASPSILPCLFWQQISCLFLRQQLPEQLSLGIAFGLSELPSEDRHAFVVKKFFHDVLRSGWRLQVMPSEPENRVRFHRIGLSDRNVDVMAAATLKGSDVEPRWAERYLCQTHAGVAFRAMRTLDRCE
jgi:hypothetical protein